MAIEPPARHLHRYIFSSEWGRQQYLYIICEVCEAICKVLGPKYMSVPLTVEKCSDRANAFESR